MRLLRKQSGFAVIAILTLALGIGASTAIFSVVDAAVLRPLPYPDPEQLVEVEIRVERSDRPGASTSWPRVADLRQFQQPDSPFSAIATWRSVLFERVVDADVPERVDAIAISETYLSVHGLPPVIGRGFTADDTRPGAPAVALLGHGYWQRRYGGDRGVVGRIITFDGVPSTIVGVLPRRAQNIAIWLPVAAPTDETRTAGSAIARLRPGVSREAAERQLSAVVVPRPGAAGVAQKTSVQLTPLLDQAIGGNRITTGLLTGAVGLILLLACVNVAGLLLARGATRQTELAVRSSIGAGRARLVRQLLVESVVLSSLGGAVGVLLAWLSLDGLVANIPMTLPSNSPVELNLAVLSASVGLVIATGVLFGLVPAIRLSRAPLGVALARGSRRHGAPLSRRGGQLLIAAEIALALVLVAGAGVMIRSFARLISVDLGFDPGAIVTLEATPLDPSPAVHAQFYPALLEALRAVPGVEAVGAIDHLPLGDSGSTTVATVDGSSVVIGVKQVLPGYFEAMGIPLRSGRLFTEADYAAGLPAALINETAAREMFPVGSAIGRQIIVRKRAYTVLGVVADVRGRASAARIGDQLFLPFTASADNIGRARGLTIVVRPRRDAPDLASQLRRTAESTGPRVLVERVRHGTEWFGDSVITPRQRTVLFGLLGSLALVLATVGVFGMTAYSVARRTQEIGVRMALGGRPGAMVLRLLRDSALPIAAGTLIGLAGAAAATRTIASFLFQTDPIDPLTFAAVGGLLVGAGCLAAWIPARRAAKIDPVVALRAE